MHDVNGVYINGRLEEWNHSNERLLERQQLGMRTMSPVLLLVVLAAADAQLLSRAARSDQDDVAMTLCGRNLAETRKTFCDMYRLTADKKSDRRHNLFELGPFEDDNENPRESFNKFTWPWMMSHTRASSLALQRPKRTGLVEECCFKACTLEELLSYC